MNGTAFLIATFCMGMALAYIILYKAVGKAFKLRKLPAAILSVILLSGLLYGWLTRFADRFEPMP
jgi:hypothetical protein